MAAGALMLVGSITPWAAALGGLVRKEGTARDGVITVLFGFALVGIGIATGLKKGRLWAPIVSLVLGLAALAVTVVDIHRVLGDRLVSVGFGLWLTAVAALITCFVAVVAIFLRE